jgi:hypothetical protein
MSSAGWIDGYKIPLIDVCLCMMATLQLLILLQSPALRTRAMAAGPSAPDAICDVRHDAIRGTGQDAGSPDQRAPTAEDVWINTQGLALTIDGKPATINDIPAAVRGRRPVVTMTTGSADLVFYLRAVAMSAEHSGSAGIGAPIPLPEHP